jgi:hypothetical protein
MLAMAAALLQVFPDQVCAHHLGMLIKKGDRKREKQNITTGREY